MAPLAGPPPVRSFPGGVLPRFSSLGSSLTGVELGGAGTDETGAVGGGAAGDTYEAVAQDASISPTGAIITTDSLRFRMIVWHPLKHGSSIETVMHHNPL